MPMIPDDEIDRIKHTTDLAAVIRARGVELKPSGGDLVGRCPFHDDQNPSMRVTPGKGLWRCMSCQATGNVIQFVQRFDGVSFRHAYELLKTGKLSALSAPTAGAPLKKSTVPRLESPLTPNADDQAALRQVLDYYHERLKENPAALAYLKKRGIAPEAVAAFKIGFVDRTLGLRLPQKNRKEGAEMRERLTRLGLFRDTGHEHLRGCVVFPVVAENGEIGTVYGRAIDAPTKEGRHLFLPGPQRGLWNPAALRSPEIILTEGIIDALSFWGAGYRHVTTGYSAKALPEEMLDALIAAKVRRVFIAYDRDKAGDDGTAAVAAQLAAHGIECLRVMFPPGLDANSYALSVTPPEKSLGVLLRAALPLDEMGKGKVSAPVAVSSLPPVSAPSSLAAKAAELVAERAPVSEEKTSAPTPIVTLPEAAKEEKPDVPTTTAGHEMPPASPGAGSLTLLKDEADEIVLLAGDREWRVRGLAKNAGFESLKVTVRLACAERWHLDNLDLCVARQRAAFIDVAAGETQLKPELVKRDLGHVLAKLEELQEARLKAQVEPKKNEPTLTAQEREAALALLRSPDLLGRILADFTACGVVGEETNKLVGYLAAVSRKLENPLAVIVQSTSAAGKSALMEAVLAFVPPEERVKYSALTGQALYYLGGETSLKHKILAIVEEEGAEKASYALKLLQSEGELSIASTGKDPQTGRMVTQEYRVEGPVMIFLTTTAVDIDEELLNRCLVLTVDESREQTRRIHTQQRARYTLGGIRANEARANVLALHRTAQRLLRPLRVFNPYAEKLTFLDDKTRTRRDHTKYLQLIATVAVLHQYQREIRSIDCGGGKTAPCVVATLDDIAAANRLAHDVLGRCLDDMPPQTRCLLELIERMVAAECTAKKMDRGDVGFTRRQVRESTGWSNTQLHIHLKRLEDLEYLLTHRADHGQGFVYELAYDGAGKDGRPFVCGLLDVEKLRAGYGYEEKRSGVTEPDSGSIRGTFAPSSGSVPVGNNGALPSENDALHGPTTENARPRTSEKHAAA
jgi:DNA primase catalytic core